MDFLEESYFKRLEHYLPYLKELNRVSKLYQTLKFSTGCLVPLAGNHLKLAFQPTEGDSVALANFKEVFTAAIDRYLVTPILGANNYFLRAGLLHPGVADLLCHVVDPMVLQSAWEGILDNASHLVEEGPDFDKETMMTFVKAGLGLYKKALPTSVRDGVVPYKLERDAWKALNSDGTFNGV